MFEDWEVDDDEDFNDAFTNGTTAFYSHSWGSKREGKIRSYFSWSDPSSVPLRIGVCGAGGTGKGEFSELLGRKLDIPVIHDIARTVYGMGHKLNKNADLLTEMLVWFGQQWEQLEYDEFVASGTMLDNLAYLNYFSDRLIGYDKLLTAMANVTNNLSHTDYTIWFYCPIGEKPKRDGVRSIDQKFQKAIDTNIRHWLDTFDLDFVPLVGSPKQKLKTALSYLEEFHLLPADGEDD
jgi:hypothetical protein